MKILLTLIVLFFSFSLFTGQIFAAEAQVAPHNGLPAEINELISKIMTNGCLDQHIVKQKDDGSTVKLDQRVGGGCDDTQSQTVVDQHINKNSEGKSLTLNQTITLPKSDEASQPCLDQQIQKQSHDENTEANQKVCGDVLSAVQPSTTPMPSTSPVPDVTATELPSTGAGATVAITLGVISAAIVGRKLMI